MTIQMGINVEEGLYVIYPSLRDSSICPNKVKNHGTRRVATGTDGFFSDLSHDKYDEKTRKISILIPALFFSS